MNFFILKFKKLNEINLLTNAVTIGVKQNFSFTEETYMIFC